MYKSAEAVYKSNMKITMTTGNESFQTEWDIVQALRDLADRIQQNGLAHVSKVLDINGNSVGTVEVEE